MMDHMHFSSNLREVFVIMVRRSQPVIQSICCLVGVKVEHLSSSGVGAGTSFC